MLWINAAKIHNLNPRLIVLLGKSSSYLKNMIFFALSITKGIVLPNFYI